MLAPASLLLLGVVLDDYALIAPPVAPAWHIACSPSQSDMIHALGSGMHPQWQRHANILVNVSTAGFKQDNLTLKHGAPEAGLGATHSWARTS